VRLAGSVPALYLVAVVIVALSWWGRDARGLLLAAVCVAVGAMQQARADREAREAAEAEAREVFVDPWEEA
jgi:hypothetical protein